MVEKKFEIRFISEVYLVKSILKDVLQFVEEAIPSLSKDDKTDLKLIFSELLCNAVIHGNQEDISKSVCLTIVITNDVIMSRIMDEGPGFDYTKLISSFQGRPDYTNESGRGIRLVYSLTDGVTFNTIGNEINFYKRVALHG